MTYALVNLFTGKPVSTVVPQLPAWENRHLAI